MRDFPAGAGVQVTLSGVEHDVREGAADADEAIALLELFVRDGEGEVLVDLSF